MKKFASSRSLNKILAQCDSSSREYEEIQAVERKWHLHLATPRRLLLDRRSKASLFFAAPPPPKRAPSTTLTLRSKSMTAELEELEKLDEILAAAAEPALRPDIADADSRAATVKQRPTSRRITPAEISVSPFSTSKGKLLPPGIFQGTYHQASSYHSTRFLGSLRSEASPRVWAQCFLALPPSACTIQSPGPNPLTEGPAQGPALRIFSFYLLFPGGLITAPPPPHPICGHLLDPRQDCISTGIQSPSAAYLCICHPHSCPLSIHLPAESHQTLKLPCPAQGRHSIYARVYLILSVTTLGNIIYFTEAKRSVN
uniref:Uncharacterized protein n=1 Tax=Spermophilus dauricus TaxID=99837 RepID=A0A8C9P2K6_SPEDA